MQGIEERAAERRAETPQRQQVRVGIVGYGTVGRATAEILLSHAEDIRERTGGISVVVTRICRRRAAAAEAGVNGVPVVSDWRQVATAEDVDIVGEMGRGHGR